VIDEYADIKPNVWEQILTGYGGSIPVEFPKAVWWLCVICGIFWAMRYRRELHELSFWLLFLAGFLVSVPFVIFDDGWRVLCTSFVILSALLASGFTSPLYKSKDESLHHNLELRKYHYGLLGLVAFLCLTVPMLTYKYDQLGALNFPQSELRADEEIFLGTQYMSGFLVLPDGEVLPKKVPAMHESEFIKIIRNSGIEQYEALVTPNSVYKPPFAIVSAVPVNNRTRGLLILPPDIFSSLDERLWRFRLENEPGRNFWKKVVEATPLTR
jgi:hypothetical protein